MTFDPVGKVLGGYHVGEELDSCPYCKEKGQMVVKQVKVQGQYVPRAVCNNCGYAPWKNR